MIFRTSLPWLGVLMAASLLLSAGCKKSEVRIYDVAKDSTHTARNALPSNEIAIDPSSVSWTKADAWQELEPTQFRLGNYRYDAGDAGVAEITVSSFPGDTGGLLANVNRWLGQAGLDSIDASQLDEIVETRSLGTGVHCSFVDLKPADGDPSATRIYAATFMLGGQSWFFKMTGPSAVVASQIPAFDEMVETLEFGAAPQSASLQDAPVTADDSDIAFTPPEGWTESEGSPVRVASLKIEKEGLPPADFSITTFPGDTGGHTANVNRWRRQIGLGPWSDAQVQQRAEHFDAPNGLHFDIFDLKSEGDSERAIGDERILVAILKRRDDSWFFKLRGDTLLLETQRNNFKALLSSVRFKDGSQ